MAIRKHIVQDSTNLRYTGRAELQFAGAGINVADDDGATSGIKRTIVTHNQATAGRHIITDEDLNDMTDRANLKFAGSQVSVSDDAGNDRTVVSFGKVPTAKVQRERGIKFTWVSGTQIRLTPNSPITDAVVHTHTHGVSLSGTSAATLTANITLDLSTSGANGLDTGAKAVSTGYYIYLITTASHAAKALIASLTSDPASVTMPGTYVNISRPIWFVRNTAGDAIHRFIHSTDGFCRYYHDDSGDKYVQLFSAAPRTTAEDNKPLNNATATSWTSFSVASYWPLLQGTVLDLLSGAEQTGNTTHHDLDIGPANNQGSTCRHESIADGSGGCYAVQTYFWRSSYDELSAGSWWYDFNQFGGSFDASRKASLWVVGWKLPNW